MDEVQRKKMEIKRKEERAKEELKVLEDNFRIKQELVQKEAQMIASITHEEEDNHILWDETFDGDRLKEPFREIRWWSISIHIWSKHTSPKPINYSFNSLPTNVWT